MSELTYTSFDVEERSRFSPEQVERLLRPIKPNRVYQAQGQSHVAGWDVVAHLTRMFGFGGWEKEILSLDLVCEDSEVTEKNDKKRVGWWVTYRCQMRLRVFGPDRCVVVEIDDAATGTASNMPSRGDAHDFAVKNSITYALKRCAKDLGDQFGLSLYASGSLKPVVGMTLVGMPGEEPEHEVTGEELSVDPETGEVVG